MNETNRAIIVLFAAAIFIAMAVIIFLAWTAGDTVVDRLGDMVEYMDAHRDNAGKLIVTLAALILAVLALLLIIVELAPEDEEKELRVEQAGATTIVPAQALKARLEERLLTLAEVTAARARVATRDKGIAAALDVTVAPGANVGTVTQESVRIVVDTVQTELGLPVSGVPAVRVTFGGVTAPVASSVAQPPGPEPNASLPDSGATDWTPPAGSPPGEPPRTPPSSTPEPPADAPPDVPPPGGDPQP